MEVELERRAGRVFLRPLLAREMVREGRVESE